MPTKVVGEVTWMGFICHGLLQVKKGSQEQDLDVELVEAGKAANPADQSRCLPNQRSCGVPFAECGCMSSQAGFFAAEVTRYAAL